ncbi:enoyl-CoA hydratase/isomerase [Pseudophaeobacter sp.]|jgi:2-(1,2-epoxy-1,2-dihydrophenyl)acetyl-CoA isomerase|uniref:enoyl-CoA hydratase/isomerase n=1 Tax=Pseudophaeobacter sp. TaxID=1971739 RepID=UPI0032D96B4A
MTDELVEIRQKDGIATLTLNDPDAMNAMSLEMATAMAQALKRLAQPEAATRCLVITGRGRGFCAGANLKRRLSQEERDEMTGTILQLYYHPVFRLIRDFPAPVVTAVNGAAVGAGMSLAMMGDIILAGRSAYFLQAFRNIGLVPDCGSSWLLPRLIGAARAREMSLLGERLPAETALEWGLVNRVCDDSDLDAAAQEIAEKIASGPVRAQTAIRTLYWESPHQSFEEQLDLEDQFQVIAAKAPEAQEGVAAFTQKRKADFRAIVN